MRTRDVRNHRRGNLSTRKGKTKQLQSLHVLLNDNRRLAVQRVTRILVLVVLGERALPFGVADDLKVLVDDIGRHYRVHEELPEPKKTGLRRVYCLPQV